MGFYHFIVGIGTLIVLAMVWALLLHAVDVAQDTFVSTTPATFGNHSVDTADVVQQYSFAHDAFYYSYFFFTIIIIMWIVKSVINEQAVIGGE
jgi:hypothetical protein